MYDFIIKAFETTCKPLGITKESLPSYTAFMTYETFLNVSRAVKIFYKEDMGCVALKEKDHNTLVVKWLCVSEKFRKQGKGKRLLEFCEFYAKSKGKTQLFLACYKGNTDLINWYEKHGFAIRKNKGKSGLICFMKKEI